MQVFGFKDTVAKCVKDSIQTLYQLFNNTNIHKHTLHPFLIATHAVKMFWTVTILHSIPSTVEIREGSLLFLVSLLVHLQLVRSHNQLPMAIL